jgi:hypothetical protein
MLMVRDDDTLRSTFATCGRCKCRKDLLHLSAANLMRGSYLCCACMRVIASERRQQFEESADVWDRKMRTLRVRYRSDAIRRITKSYLEQAYHRYSGRCVMTGRAVSENDAAFALVDKTRGWVEDNLVVVCRHLQRRVGKEAFVWDASAKGRIAAARERM